MRTPARRLAALACSRGVSAISCASAFGSDRADQSISTTQKVDIGGLRRLSKTFETNPECYAADGEDTAASVGSVN